MRAQPSDVQRMTDTLYVDGPLRGPKSSKFWILLVLAAVIATAGVMADSTATVIGAMIVAPLMTPILGTALAIVLAQRRPLVGSVALVLGGAVVVVAVGFLLGLVGAPLDAFAVNGQVTGRINPRLIDLIAALATGTVGAFALARSDISDTLPGVAIAISLVPPLAVVGLLLSVQRYSDAGGAALLFGTNVAAIIATGVVVFLGFRVREAATEAGLDVGEFSGASLAVVSGMLVLVAVPLAVGSWAVAQDQLLAAQARPVAERWAAQNRWSITTLEVSGRHITISALGAPPEALPSSLRAALNDNGMADADLSVRLALGGAVNCPPYGTQCQPRVGASG